MREQERQRERIYIYPRICSYIYLLFTRQKKGGRI